VLIEKNIKMLLNCDFIWFRIEMAYFLGNWKNEKKHSVKTIFYGFSHEGMFQNKNFNAFVKEIFFINTFNCNIYI